MEKPFYFLAFFLFAVSVVISVFFFFLDYTSGEDSGVNHGVVSGGLHGVKRGVAVFVSDIFQHKRRSSRPPSR